MAYLFSRAPIAESLEGCGRSCACTGCRDSAALLAGFGSPDLFGAECADCGPSCGCGPCRGKHGGLSEWYIKEDDDSDDNDQAKSPQAAKTPVRAEAPGVGRFGNYASLHGRYGPRPFGSLGLAPAVAIPAVPVITAAAVLEAIAFVLSALAAAYLLIKAYEAAKDRGFGVALAAQALSAGLGTLIEAGRRMAEGLRRILEKAKQHGNRDPRCRDAIERVMRTLGEIIGTLTQLETAKNEPIPSVLELRRLMRQLGNWMNLAKSEVAFLIQACGPVMTR